MPDNLVDYNAMTSIIECCGIWRYRNSALEYGWQADKLFFDEIEAKLIQDETLKMQAQDLILPPLSQIKWPHLI